MTVSKVKAIHRVSQNVNREENKTKQTKKNWGEPWLRDGWAMGGYVELTAGQVTISPTTTTTIWPNISPLSLSLFLDAFSFCFLNDMLQVITDTTL